MNMLDELRHTAVHEAGHAVVGRVLGLLCGPATIVPNEEETAGVAIVHDPWMTASHWDQKLYEHVMSGGDGPAPKSRAYRSFFRAAILARMAGAEAENVILGQCAGGDGDDEYWIAMVVDSGDAEFSEAEWERSEPRMRRQVGCLIRRHRDKIENVATALLERCTLSAAEIDAVLGG
jgi:hypothetical protein